jgi:tellurite resistance protein
MPAIRSFSPSDLNQREHRTRRIPPNLFAIVFGLTGLAEAWHAAGKILGIPAAVPDAIFIGAAAVWLVLVAGYAAQGLRQLASDLRDPVLAPFVPVATIPPMLLSAELSTAAFTAGRVLVVIFLTLTIAVGGWLIGQWIAGSLDQDRVHPGYFLPTVADGLVGASAAAAVHLHVLGEASFGIGIISWLLLGSNLLYRLFFRPMLPAALVPTLAIEVAPSAIAGFAYFALTGGAINFMARALGGYAVLMALAQLRFIPLYARLSFSPRILGLYLLARRAGSRHADVDHAHRPPGATGYAIAVITLITVLITAIAARTIIAIARVQFRPAPLPEAAQPRQQDGQPPARGANTTRWPPATVLYHFLRRLATLRMRLGSRVLTAGRLGKERSSRTLSTPLFER